MGEEFCFHVSAGLHELEGFAKRFLRADGKDLSEYKILRMEKRTKRFQALAAVTYATCLLVILWGAWVRISKSGAGCGDHWPLCQGSMVPQNPTVATLIEFTHRASTLVFSLLLLGMVVSAYRYFPKGHAVRWVSTFAVVFTLLEAVIGAVLVLAGLVGTNESMARTIVIAAHLANSLLLSGSIALCGLVASGDGRLKLAPRAYFPLVLFLLVGGTGAIASLASTLFPSENLLAAIANDFGPTAHHLLRARVLHPLIALVTAGIFFRYFAQVDGPLLQHLRKAGLILWPAAVLLGIGTLVFLSPLWMKLSHLGMAHLLWALGIVLFVREERAAPIPARA